MGGQKRQTISAMKKKAQRERKPKEDKKVTRVKLPYLSSKELEKKAFDVVKSAKYITPYLLSAKVETKLSRSKEILRKLSSQGSIELVEKNGDVEIYALA